MENEIAYMLNLPTTVAVAFAVLANKYGVNEERKQLLEKAGFDYATVQNCVNDLIKLLRKYGD